jgi:hypothetical protein
MLEGPGIDTTNDAGLWAISPDGYLKSIIREGSLFDVDDAPQTEDLRTVMVIEDRGLNNAGQLAFHLTFTDGTSGIFVATLGLPGDLDGDGFVGINDLNLILTNWNQTVPPGDALADANGDDYIGIADLNAVLGNWNAGTPPTDSANIPEPATGLICLTGLILVNRRAG